MRVLESTVDERRRCAPRIVVCDVNVEACLLVLPRCGDWILFSFRLRDGVNSPFSFTGRVQVRAREVHNLASTFLWTQKRCITRYTTSHDTDCSTFASQIVLCVFGYE